MADKRITELNLHTSLTLSDVIPIVSGGETKKTTYGSLYYGIREGVVSGSEQISFNGITDKPTLVSGSSQVSYLGLSNIPNNIVSSSQQITALGFVSSSITGSSLVTASIQYQTLTFTKGDGSSFNLTIPETTGSIFITGGVETVDYIDFNISANPTHEEGRIHWYDDAKTLAIDTGQQDFMIEVGAMTVIRGKNDNSFTLTKGMVVYINGEAGQRPTFTTASMVSEGLSARTMGIVASTITPNNSGFVISNGVLRNINTSMYPANTELYLSSSGQFSSQVPTAPNHNVRIGKVLSSHTNGSIYVYVMNGFELNELHDVLISTASLKDAATNNGGSTLYRTGSVWRNSDNVRLTNSNMILASVSSSYNFADDTTAASGGVPLGGLYHTSGSVKIRLV